MALQRLFGILPDTSHTAPIQFITPRANWRDDSCVTFSSEGRDGCLLPSNQDGCSSVARIRTIKPEFWTDEKIVSLPFEARLLFIGLWSYADDTGALDYSVDRLRMQIFPGDGQTDVDGLIDLLVISDLLDVWIADDGSRRLITVRNWSKHQKIDNPTRKTICR